MMKKHAYVLGLDIGSNSVGSAAWVRETNQIVTGVSVFPAGVEQSDRGRGDPVGRGRRLKRTLRRMLARRAERKREVWRTCIEVGLLPATRAEMDVLLQDETKNPWRLRAEGLDRALEPHEFGRVLLHMAQRRGGLGLNLQAPEDDQEEQAAGDDERASRAAFGHTNVEMKRVGARSYGELIWKLHQESRRTTADGTEYFDAVRNRHDLLVQSPERAFFASREIIRAEFAALWSAQQSFKTPLAKILTHELKQVFDDPREDEDWRHQGILFGQRRTNLGVLGRCTLEPTDRCVPLADMHAQHYRVIETVNNLRIRRAEREDVLSASEREKVLALLKGPLVHESGKHKGKAKRSASATDIKKALGLPLRDKSVRLNIEDRDGDREINTDWFSRTLAHGVFGAERWAAMDQNARESVNRAVLRFDPENADHETRLREGCRTWWKLGGDQTEAFIAAWRQRPKLELRLKMSRRAILNLLPYMERVNAESARWPTQIEARKAFAEDADAKDVGTGGTPAEDQRRRYFTGVKGLTHRDRHFLGKHPDLLPPAPMMTNPVVRKAIHEVRRHIVAYIRHFGCKPERVVLEFTRDATQSGKMRDEILKRNRWRDKQRKEVGDGVVSAAWGAGLHGLSHNQRRVAVDRVLLARQQQQTCPYCGQAGLTERKAALRQDCEIDHIQPYSATGDNSLNNKVLCCISCNRAKKKQSPRQWWGEQFEAKAQAAKSLFHEREWSKGDYFTWRDYQRKWANFGRETPAASAGGFGPGQLEATAYAARAVKAYLSDALYGGTGSSEHGGERNIYVTHGRYTAMLRRDWNLFQTLRDDARHADAAKEAAESGGQKNRADHRHHAIDAVVIALTTPEILPRLGEVAKEAEEYFVRTGMHGRRDPLSPPFGSDVAEFRCAVISQIFEAFDRAAKTGAKIDGAEMGAALIVSHRPVKRRLVGHLHKDTLYGPVLRWNGQEGAWERDPTKTTGRIRIAALKPNHLRVPDGWDERSAQVNDRTTPESVRRMLRRELAMLEDPPPGKSGIVRDRALRDRLRRALRGMGLDPDSFTDKQLKAKLDADAVVTLDSGKPVRSAVLLRTNSDPVVIGRKRWNRDTGRMEIDPDPRTLRIYDSQNNHHVEIREDAKGRWRGEVVTMFEAARRVRGVGCCAVDRSDDDKRGGRFVLSLCEGEMVHMKHPKQGYVDYFVVFKIDKKPDGSCGYIWFTHHWDGRGASERKGPDGVAIAGSAREEVSVTPAQMSGLGCEEGGIPRKVRVSPLGQVQGLAGD